MTVLLVVVVLLLLNALFVAAEFAIVGVPRVAVERRAAEGDRVAVLVRDILQDPRRQDRYIATAQLGITVASLGLGMYGEHHLAEAIGDGLASAGLPVPGAVAHTAASVLAVAILTYFHIVVGEMIPKSLALTFPEETVRAVTPPMLGTQRLLLGVVVALNGLGNALLRLLGVRPSVASSEGVRTPEELRYIVRESQAGGMLRRESAAVVQELLDFADRTAEEVMVPRVHVVGLPVGATADELRAIVRRAPHTRYPVYEGDRDHIAGMVHMKDLFRVLRERRALRASDAREIPFVPAAADSRAVLRALREARTQMAVVMDEHGGTAGIVTVQDLYREIVGPIEEGPVALPELYRDGEGRAVALGTVRLDEVGECLGVVLEHDEVDTVSGLVLTLLGRPPRPGDAVTWDDVRFEVTRVEGHGVAQAVASCVSGGAPAPAAGPPSRLA